MAVTWEHLKNVSFLGIGDYLGWVVGAGVIGSIALMYGWPGLLTAAVLMSSMGLVYRVKDIINARYCRGMWEASDRTKELVEGFAHDLDIESPKVRVLDKESMLEESTGFETIGKRISNPLGKDVVVVHETAEEWITASWFDESEEGYIHTLLAHETAHTAQSPTALLQSATFGVPFVVGAIVFLFTNLLFVTVGGIVATALVRKVWINRAFRRSEYDAEAQSARLAGVKAIRDFHSEPDPCWRPFYPHPSSWERVNYLKMQGLY